MTLPLVAYYTSRMGFHVRAGTDKADYQDFIDMMSKLDGAAGLVLCTEATKPSTNLFPGMYIKCTDSGLHYVYGGGSFSSGVYSGGSWTQDIYVTVVSVASGNGNMIYAGSDTVGWSTSVDGNRIPVTTSGKASTPFSTVNSNQVVAFDVNISQGIDWNAASMAVNSIAGVSSATGTLAYLYLTIDGVDNLVAKVYYTDFNCGQVSAANIGDGHSNKTYKFVKSIAAAGTHTCTLKQVTTQFDTTGGAAATLYVDYVNIAAMVSVS